MNYSQIYPYFQEVASSKVESQRLLFTKEASEKLYNFLIKDIYNFDESKVDYLSDDKVYAILGWIKTGHVWSEYLFSEFYLVEWLDNLQLVKIYADYDACINIEFDV